MSTCVLLNPDQQFRHFAFELHDVSDDLCDSIYEDLFSRFGEPKPSTWFNAIDGNDGVRSFRFSSIERSLYFRARWAMNFSNFLIDPHLHDIDIGRA